MSEQEQAYKQLRTVRARRQRHLANDRQVSAALHAAIIAADAVGIPRLRIARELGVARQTVYNVLDAKGA